MQCTVYVCVCVGEQNNTAQSCARISMNRVTGTQCRRSVVKHGAARVSQVKPSNCFRLHPTSIISKHSTIPVPDSLWAPRKNSFAFHFWRKAFILDDVKLAELSNNSFEWKNVTFYGGKTYSDPSYIFSGSQDPHPRVYAPAMTKCLDFKHIPTGKDL